MAGTTVIIGVGGMGAAIARRIGSGTALHLADFDEKLLEQVTTQLRVEGFQVSSSKVDVGTRSSIATAADAAMKFGPLRHVVHTAGLSGAASSAAAILRVNLLGVAYMLEEFGSRIEPGGAGVVIASTAGALMEGQIPAPVESQLASASTDSLLDLDYIRDAAAGDPGLAYAISKRANQLRIQAASMDWGARGARVNTLSPGIIATPMSARELNGPNAGLMHAQIEASGTKRIGTPSDIADGVAFLLSPAASFITGTDLRVDGGQIPAARFGQNTAASAVAEY